MQLLGPIRQTADHSFHCHSCVEHSEGPKITTSNEMVDVSNAQYDEPYYTRL